MPQRVQSLRTSVKNTRPTAGTREPGEIYVSFPDLQLGVINAGKAAQDLIAIRFFSTATDYVAGDFVIQGGVGYKAKATITAGAFNPAQWDTIPTTGNFEPPITLGTTAQYWRGDKSWQTLNPTAVGLGNVDNTSDANKPISGPTQAALNLKAPLASPTFTGIVVAPTPAPGTNNTTVATTAFVALSYAPINSPNLTGDPTAPTPATADNDVSIATTAYVKANLASYAPLASPVFTGNPTAPTPPTDDNDTSIATTAFVQGELTEYLKDAPNDGLTYGRKSQAWATMVGGAVVSDAAPGAPLQNGQLWFKSNEGNTYIWVDDGNTTQWVMQNVMPATGSSPVATAQTRSRIVNGAMQISQEWGLTVVAGNGVYPADQWMQVVVSSSTIQSAQSKATNGTEALNQPSIIGIGAAPAETAAAAGEIVTLQQTIEGIRVSDFLWGTAQARQAVIAFDVYLPVAGTYWVSIYNSSVSHSWLGSYTISAGETLKWVRKSVVVPAGTINAGTWLTTTGQGFTLRFAFHIGSTYTGVAGLQTGNIAAGPGQALGLSTATGCYLTNVGLYLDPQNTGVAPAWQMPDEAQELEACRRYWHVRRILWSGAITSGIAYIGGAVPAVTMRVNPTLTGTIVSQAGFPATVGSLAVANPFGIQEQRNANATSTSGYFDTTVVLNARM